MYGTVAHVRVKPGMERQLEERLVEFEIARVPGAVAVYVYRMDADPNDYYLAVMFAGKKAYLANANSPEQNDRYERLLELLEAEPEWHDGEITHYRDLTEI